MRKELLDISRDRRTLAHGAADGPVAVPGADARHGRAGREPRRRPSSTRCWRCRWSAPSARRTWSRSSPRNGIAATKPPADLEAAIARQDIDVAHRDRRGLRARTGAKAGRPRSRSCSDSTRQQRRDPDRARARRADRLRAARSARCACTRAASTRAVTQRGQRRHARPRAAEEPSAAQLLSALLPYLLILTSFLGGAYLIIDATAGERERQSLEPLLATPARAARSSAARSPRPARWACCRCC